MWRGFCCICYSRYYSDSSSCNGQQDSWCQCHGFNPCITDTDIDNSIGSEFVCFQQKCMQGCFDSFIGFPLPVIGCQGNGFRCRNKPVLADSGISSNVFRIALQDRLAQFLGCCRSGSDGLFRLSYFRGFFTQPSKWLMMVFFSPPSCIFGRILTKRLIRALSCSWF